MAASVERITRSFRPGCPIDDSHRAIVPVVRYELGHDLVQHVDRKVDCKRCTRRREISQCLAWRHGRGAAGRSRQHNRLAKLGKGQLLMQRGRGGGKGRDAGRQRVRNSRAIEPAKLLA